MSEHIVTIKDVVFSRGERKIYDHLNLTIPTGKITAVLGPSGTGKTTLLHLIGGLLKPDSGKIEVCGQEVPKLSRQKLFNLREQMGMLFQSGGLFTDMNVFDNVAFPIRQHTNLSEELIRNVVLMKLEAVGLRGAHALMPSELSGGMSRRVALARAVALDPELMLYDEPLTGQDPISKAVVLKLIKLLNDALNLTSIIVTHDVEDVFSIADYVYIISDKKVIEKGTPDEIRQTTSQAAKQFVQGLPDGPVQFHYPAPEIKTDFMGANA